MKTTYSSIYDAAPISIFTVKNRDAHTTTNIEFKVEDGRSKRHAVHFPGQVDGLGGISQVAVHCRRFYMQTKGYAFSIVKKSFDLFALTLDDIALTRWEAMIHALPDDIPQNLLTQLKQFTGQFIDSCSKTDEFEYL